MRQKVTYTENQIIEMGEFYAYCVRCKVDFENYCSICSLARLFQEEYESEGNPIECTVPLLALSTIIRYRGDTLKDVIKRDLVSSKSVRIHKGLLKRITENDA